MQTLVSDPVDPDELLILRTMDSIIAEGRIVSQRLLKQSVAEQLSATYDIIIRKLVEKGLVEEVYSEGFDLALRRVGS